MAAHASLGPMRSPKPPRKRMPPRTPRQQENRMVRRRPERRARKSDALEVDAVVASAAEAVRQAWEQHEDAP